MPATRDDAQRWLALQRYEPGVVNVGNPLWLVAAAFVPWVFSDDQPPDEIAAARYRTSLPASIEAFVRAQWPSAERIAPRMSASRGSPRRVIWARCGISVSVTPRGPETAPRESAVP